MHTHLWYETIKHGGLYHRITTLYLGTYSLLQVKHCIVYPSRRKMLCLTKCSIAWSSCNRTDDKKCSSKINPSDEAPCSAFADYNNTPSSQETEYFYHSGHGDYAISGRPTTGLITIDTCKVLVYVSFSVSWQLAVFGHLKLRKILIHPLINGCKYMFAEYLMVTWTVECKAQQCRARNVHHSTNFTCTVHIVVLT
jgi:hypothetical protein